MKNDINAAVMKTLADCRQRRLFVGFSGGIDSTALLIAAQRAAAALHLDLTAVHFDHGIRGRESLADAVWCQRFCSEHDIDFRLIKLRIPERLENGENLEEFARRQRLLHWRELTKSSPNSVVLLGHHNDDRLENLLLRLCRGSNVSGLTGLRAISKLDGITFIRPLLPFSKAEIGDYLKSSGREGRFDHTNQDNTFSRNFIRNRILPEIYNAIPPAKAGIAHAADALEDDARLLEELASVRYRKIKNMPEPPISFWRKLPPALLVRVLRLWLTDAVGTELIPSRNLVKRFNAELHSGKNRKTVLPVNSELQIIMQDGGCRVCIGGNDKSVRTNPVLWHWQEQPTIRFQDKIFTATIMDRKPPRLSRSPDHAWFDAALLPEELWLTERDPGDRMIRFGSNSPTKVKKIVIDAKLTAAQKKSLPVVKTASGEIIWLPDIKNAAFAPITADTTRIVVLICKIFRHSVN